MKAKGLAAKMRVVNCDRPAALRINTKDALREAITDYIIHDLSGSSNFRKMKNRNYQPVKAHIVVNGKEETFPCELTLILCKYSLLCKGQLDNGARIDELTQEILDFIEKLEDQTNGLTYDMQGDVDSERLITVLTQKHFREKRREILQGQFNQAKKTLFTKYKKVLFNKEEDRKNMFPSEMGSQDNSQRVSRSTVTALMERQEYGKKHLQVPSKSKLKNLVDSCNVFDFPQRVEALRRQKMIVQFCGGKQADFIQVRQQVKKHYPCPSSSNLTVQTMHQLEDWINEISISEALFKRKYEPQPEQKQNKRKSSDSSSSQEDLP